MVGENMKKPLLYRILRPILKVFMSITFRPNYIGLENIPKEGSVVLAGNHTKILDPLLIVSCTNRTVYFLAKEELYKGFKGIIFRHMGIIPVNRSIHDKDALKKAKQILNEDKVIGIFPEGTVNKTKDTIMPFKIGAVKMAHDTSSKIVPFVIKGKYKIFGKITIKFLKGYKINKDLTKENEKLMNIIKTNLERR